MDFDALNASIPGPKEQAAQAAQARLDDIAKPVGSLGELEALLVRIASIGGDVDFAKRMVFVLASDNGVILTEGVATTPPEITVAMASFMAERRSSVCIMAAQCNTDVELVDMGMFNKLDVPGILDRHVADGTADLVVGPAMTPAQAEQAIQTGIDLVRDAKEKGYRLLATGEMGIGNTTTSAALTTALLGLPPEQTTGRGVGLTDDELVHKTEKVKEAIALHVPQALLVGDRESSAYAFDVLCRLGGFDIAGMCGIFLGGALYGVPILVDGFISAISALVAVRLCPAAAYALVPSHVSAEPGAVLVLKALGLNPIIHAGMHLGEGTGAVALIPILDQVAAVYRDLMTFADIGM